jgi:hypothetical protein
VNCPKHPETPLTRTEVFSGRPIMTCPHCTAEWVDTLVNQPDVITIRAGDWRNGTGFSLSNSKK